MAAIAPQFVDFDNRRISADINQKKPLSRIVGDYLTSSSGAFHFVRLLQKVTALAAHVLKQIGSAASKGFKTLSNGLQISCGMIGIPRLYTITSKARSAAVNWFRSPAQIADHELRSQLENVRDVSLGVSEWSYAGSLLLMNATMKVVGDVFGLFADSTDLKLAGQDWVLSMNHLEVLDAQSLSTSPVRDRLSETARLALIRVVKAACAVFSGVIGFITLFLGGPVLPAVTMIALGLICTVSSMTTHFYEETMTYPKVNFFKLRSPELLVAGQPAY